MLLNVRTSKLVPRLSLLGHAHFPTRVPGECVHWQYEGRRGRPDPVNVEPHWRGALSRLCCCVEGGGADPSLLRLRLSASSGVRLSGAPVGGADWLAYVCM